MNHVCTITILAFIFATLTACAVNNQAVPKTNMCSSTWYSSVEKQISTGDDYGHGPDIGSMEWRSVVEFKLGIRGDNNIPAIESDQWCKYINNNYLTKTE